MSFLIASPIDPEAIELLHQHHQVICVFDGSEKQLQDLITDCEA